MIIEPKMRGFICFTSHPKGCEQNVLNQINYVKSKGAIDGAKKVLVIGSSTGFGLASRITSAFGSNAATLGVCFEKPGTEGKPGTAGWYNSAAFEKFATEEGLYAKTINGDAFSNEVKQEAIEAIKKDLGQVDLVIYSLASPRRTNPVDGKTYRSVLKPINGVYSNKTVDFHTGKVSEVSIQPVKDEEEIENTVKVMGGEDWKMWIEAMRDAGVLADGAKTVAYSYIGPEITFPIYRNGTIGKAKDHLEATAHELTDYMSSFNGEAYVSVNKALVTQASAAIPVIPLYISLLFKVMKEEGIHEGCIEQIQRLYSERLYTGGEVPVDDKGLIRVDDWEMREDIQEKVSKLWDIAGSDNLSEIGDLEGYKHEFMSLFGFDIEGVDYAADVDETTSVKSIQ
ncbi:trans-2-enoyl-CoA reductase family protein [Halosquirtibacter laminarini]|uniref:Trans-2-enoyl-CoA reductase family protein n=1 Tax=Halosquirtibacter laminarini TaxID=3374600 RepID=A0AC61NBV9_9BACT|nr:trans-2-enoyl-CoA reductase family protein [Prolixibacteraceae bacterium]